MSGGAKTLAKKIFQILAEAESKAHGIPVEQVHFHEVGAIDSIVDVIALAVCFDSLQVTKVYVPSLTEGRGSIRCQHGILPVPVPAVANIVSAYGIPLELCPAHGEFVTPTGAAFVAAVRSPDRLPASFCIRKVGMGAGKRTYERPSILRAFLIEEKRGNPADGSPASDTGDFIVKLETNIDDCSAEQLGFSIPSCYLGKLASNFIFYALFLMPIDYALNSPNYMYHDFVAEHIHPYIGIGLHWLALLGGMIPGIVLQYISAYKYGKSYIRQYDEIHKNETSNDAAIASDDSTPAES